MDMIISFICPFLGIDKQYRKTIFFGHQVWHAWTHFLIIQKDLKTQVFPCSLEFPSVILDIFVIDMKEKDNHNYLHGFQQVPQLYLSYRSP